MKNSTIDFTQRNVAIDLLRALTMFVMIFVNDLWTIHDVPHWLEHAKRGEDFMGLADVVFPCFLFTVGMSIPFAIERRYAKGFSAESTIGHILSRTLALLLMGAFICNSESGISDAVGYKIGLYWILMVIGFVCVWNQYPRTDDVNKKRLYSLLKIVGLAILFYLAITFRSAKDGVFSAGWWGILGAIGWTYLLCAFIYVFTRDRLKYLVPVWIVFVLICIFGTRLNEANGGEAILNLPRPNLYNDFLGILHIGNGALPAFTMGGIILSLLSTKYIHLANKKKAIYVSIAVLVLFIAGFIARKFWILSKLSASPTWIFYVTGIAVAAYAILYWMSEKGWAHWFNFIKPAGTATLTCYLIPYISYGIGNLTGLRLPDWFTHGYMGILNCVCFSLIIIGVTWLLGRIHIKLKI